MPSVSDEVGLSSNTCQHSVCSPRQSLRSLFLQSGTDKGWYHGFERYYEPFLERLRDKPVRLVEIGVEDGQSMEAWMRYFTKADHIFGIGYGNLNDWQAGGVTNCSDYPWRKSFFFHQGNFNLFSLSNIGVSDDFNGLCSLLKGDQSETEFLDFFKEETGGKFDVVIDDGSHVPSHQLTSFESLWPSIVPGGFYFIEDVFTSYWKESAEVYGYKLTNQKSLVERLKLVADVLNRRYTNGQSPLPSMYDDISSIQFGQNIVIVQKQGVDERNYFEGPYRFSLESGGKGLPYP